MNSDKLLRVGVPMLGLCFFAVFQTGCRSQVLDERQAVPPAEREIVQKEDAFDDDLSKNPAPAADKKIEDKSVKDTAPANKDFVYPKFEDTEHKPIYSAPKKAAKTKTVAPGATYVVVRGDSLSKIAARHRVKTIDLAKANDLQLTSVIRVGQKLRIPGGKTAVAGSESKTASSASTATVRSGLYTVRKGDSIARIAKRLKIKRADLMAENNLNEQSVLQIGQTLKLPGAKVVNEESVVVEKTDAAPVASADSAAPSEQKSASEEDDIVKEIDGDSAASTSAAAAVAKTAADETAKVVSDATPVEVRSDISVDEFCKRYKVSKEDIFRLNSDIQADTAVIKAGTVVSLP